MLMERKEGKRRVMDFNLRPDEYLMLERIRRGLDTDIDLSPTEKSITRRLYQRRLIGAAPIEGSDWPQDALWITVAGLMALNTSRLEIMEAVGYINVQREILRTAVERYPAEMTAILSDETRLLKRAAVVLECHAASIACA
jgi:hypothetical protein